MIPETAPDVVSITVERMVIPRLDVSDSNFSESPLGNEQYPLFAALDRVGPIGRSPGSGSGGRFCLL